MPSALYADVYLDSYMIDYKEKLLKLDLKILARWHTKRETLYNKHLFLKITTKNFHVVKSETNKKCLGNNLVRHTHTQTVLNSKPFTCRNKPSLYFKKTGHNHQMTMFPNLKKNNNKNIVVFAIIGCTRN